MNRGLNSGPIWELLGKSVVLKHVHFTPIYWWCHQLSEIFDVISGLVSVYEIQLSWDQTLARFQSHRCCIPLFATHNTFPLPLCGNMVIFSVNLPLSATKQMQIWWLQLGNSALVENMDQLFKPRLLLGRGTSSVFNSCHVLRETVGRNKKNPYLGFLLYPGLPGEYDAQKCNTVFQVLLFSVLLQQATSRIS